jgi:hypothetical protein
VCCRGSSGPATGNENINNNCHYIN